MMNTEARPAAAEFAGTGFLVMAVVGSGVMAEALAEGNLGVALLANTLATGAILYVLITALGPISGAHLNPAVTLTFLRRGELSLRVAALFGCAQILGGLCGAALAHLMFGQPPLQISGHVRSGVPQLLSEAIATFGLVATILLVRHHRRAAVPAAVALYIVAAYWFTASTSFANPAVTLARSVSDTFAGIRPLDAPLFILAQLGGALAATATVQWMLSPTPAGEVGR